MLRDKIRAAIEMLKGSGIYGCISGSCMIDDDFDAWSSVPDVDVFVYCPEQLLYATTILEGQGYKPCSPAEQWKLNKLRHGQKAKKTFNMVQTHKLEKDGVIVNVTFKPNCTSLTDVLASFDMSIIMIGYDIEGQFGLDYRINHGQVFGEEANKWSDSINKAVPNPLRSQEFDMYTTSHWVRQFDRVIKYWDRGYDTRPMAQFYIDAVTAVLENGALFTNDKAEAAYAAFKEEFVPVRERMVEWLKDKEDC